jgi:hypothetical protein
MTAPWPPPNASVPGTGLVGREARVRRAGGRPARDGDPVVADLAGGEEAAVAEDAHRGPAPAGRAAGGDATGGDEAPGAERWIEIERTGDGGRAGRGQRGQDDEDEGDDDTAGRGHPPHHRRPRA